MSNGHGHNNGIGASFPLEELSWSITKNASVVSQYLGAQNLPQPSFEGDGPSNILSSETPQHIRQSLQHLVSACLELTQLAIGPSAFLPNLATNFQYVSCISWLCQYNIFDLVPLNGIISYEDLAASAKVPKQRLKSIIGMVMTNALFRQQPDGQSIGHSAMSALLARDNDMQAWASFMCKTSAPMALQMVAAHQRWGPNTVKKNETAYNVAFDTDLPFFDHVGSDESRVKEFAGYMRNVQKSEGVNLNHLVAGFAWADLQKDSIVVDVGGSTGSAAIMLANNFPHPRFVVEDLAPNAEAGRKAAADSLPAQVLSRLTFQAHDFTQPQPVRGAAIYLLRMILHDWPDEEAVKIVRSIVGAMEENGSRLLIMDTVLPKPGSVPVSVERIVRVRDLTMMQAFNSKERDLDDWNTLLVAADQRLQLANVVQPSGSDMSILEVVLGPVEPRLSQQINGD